MKTSTHDFVFVPGSFHGAWCWYKMQSLLNIDGNTSMAIDLPGHGIDTTPLNTISLESYVDCVCAELQRHERPVVLIGHSRAGIVISQVAERMPEKIHSLVYLCAYLIPNAEPMVATALSDSGSALVNNLIFNEVEGWHVPTKEIYREAFYHDCSEDDVWLCSSLLRKEPNAPVATPLVLSESRFGSVRKVYIRTLADRTITPSLQDMMIARMPVDRVYSLSTSHSPFVSQPKALADILLGLDDNVLFK